MLNILISPGEGVRLQTRRNFLLNYQYVIGAANHIVFIPFQSLNA